MFCFTTWVLFFPLLSVVGGWTVGTGRLPWWFYWAHGWLLGSTGVSPAPWAEGAVLPPACGRRWALRPLQAFWSPCTWLGCRDRADCGPWPASCDSQLLYRVSWLPVPSAASLLLSSEALGLSGRTRTSVLCQDLGRRSYRFPYVLVEAALLRRTVAWRAVEGKVLGSGCRVPEPLLLHSSPVLPVSCSFHNWCIS